MRPAFLLLLLPSLALAGDVDPASLYRLSTAGSTAQLRPGQKGTVVVEIQSLQGAHVSDEAPLKLTLAGTGSVAPERQTLAYGDSVRKKSAAVKYPDPRFEVPIAATGTGPGNVEAKLTFFICTADLCLRQQKTLSVPVRVE
jgi:hypothetical protein